MKKPGDDIENEEEKAEGPLVPDVVLPCAPSHAPNPAAVPGGKPTKIGRDDDEATARSLRRENEAAQILARAGYNVIQNPPKLKNGANPDYLIEGQLFDCYAPATINDQTITGTIDKKVPRQAERLVFNLADSLLTTAEIQAIVRGHAKDPLSGNASLKQVLVINKDESIETIFP